MTLTDEEAKYLLLKAELAKLERHIQHLRTEAAALFQRQPGIRTVTHDRIPKPALEPVEVRLDLATLKPGQFAGIVQELDALLVRIGEATSRYGEISMSLSEFRTAPLTVQVDFPE